MPADILPHHHNDNHEITQLKTALDKTDTFQTVQATWGQQQNSHLLAVVSLRRMCHQYFCTG